EEAALVADRLRDGRDERDHVVLHLRLDRLHPRHVDARPLAERPRRRGGHLAALGEDVDQRELDVEPAREARLLRPEPAHLPARVARDHPASVLPKPPPPRALTGSAATSCQTIDATGATTSWAMRPPRRTRPGAPPRFTRTTCTSPPHSH